MSTSEKSPKEHRHQQTAKDFKRWLAKNPNANLKRKIGAFNAIADSNCKRIQKHTSRKSIKHK